MVTNRTPQPARGNEASQIRGRAAAHPKDGVGTGEAGRSEHRPAVGGHVGRLGSLAVGYVDAHRLQAGIGQQALEIFAKLDHGRRVDNGDPVDIRAEQR